MPDTPPDVEPAHADDVTAKPGPDSATSSAPPDSAPPDSAPRSSHRPWLPGVLIGVLVLLLGFAIAVQVRSSSSDSLATARQDDLVRILDDQNSRAARLRQQLAELETTENQLKASGDQSSVALAQAQAQLTALRILLGIIPATGPGVVLTITDPKRALKAEDLLDIVQELRGAGAESIQFDEVRIGTDSSFRDTDNGPVLDGAALSTPYIVLAIGEPATLDRALNIVGGVAATVRLAGGTAIVAQQPVVTISATRQLLTTSLATPSK